MDIGCGRGFLVKRLVFVVAVASLARGVHAETMTMAAQRDDPELFALFVKVYGEAGIDLVVEVIPPLRCVVNVKSGEMIGYLFSDFGLAEFFTGTNVVRIGLT